MNNLSPEYLRSILECRPETGELFWKERPLHDFASKKACSKWNIAKAGKPALTSVDRNGYKCGKLKNRRLMAHRALWAIVHGEFPHMIDHINGNVSDNRISNLREATPEENSRNRKIPVCNTSGFIGIHWSRQHQKWKAQIGINGRCVRLGVFDTIEDAVMARQKAEEQQGYHANHGRTTPAPATAEAYGPHDYAASVGGM